MPESRDTFTGRLERAIEEQEQQGRRRGLRLFWKKMEDRGEELAADDEELVGTALSSIQKYVSGKRRPDYRWVVEAGRVLGVRPEWLLTGDLPVRPADDLAADEAGAAEREEVGLEPEDPDAGAVTGRRWREEYAPTLERVLGGRVPALARAAIAHHWRRLDVTASGSPATRMDSEELLERLAHTIAAPLQEAGVDFSDLQQEDRIDYVMKVVDPVAFAWEQQLRSRVATWIEESAIIQRGKDAAGSDS